MVLVLKNDQLENLLPMSEEIDAIEQAFRELGQGKAMNAPRARLRYSASASRSSGRPRGSPIRNADVGASVSARRVDASHSLRGNDDTSGEPGIRLWVGTTAVPPRGRAGA